MVCALDSLKHSLQSSSLGFPHNGCTPFCVSIGSVRAVQNPLTQDSFNRDCEGELNRVLGKDKGRFSAAPTLPVELH